MDADVLGSDIDQKPEAPPKEYDNNGHLIVKLSDRMTATIKELNGLESLGADKMINGVMTPFYIAKVYALMGLASLTIDGKVQPLPPANSDAAVNRRALCFTNRELTMLLLAYEAEFMGLLDVSGDTVKN
jgi:hypothetical protein